MKTTDKEFHVRIKRMGTHWATCGIGILAPASLRDQGGIYDRCAKLVPGQVVRLPADHPLVGHHLCEIVRGPERDEFLRPWVFDTAEDAAMANPSMSQLSADQIADGLAMVEGATRKQRDAEKERLDAVDRAERAEAEVARLRSNTSRNDVDEDDEDDEDERLNDDENVRRSSNRVLREEKEAGQRLDLDGKPVEDEAPARRTRAPRRRG